MAIPFQSTMQLILRDICEPDSEVEMYLSNSSAYEIFPNTITGVSFRNYM